MSSSNSDDDPVMRSSTERYDRVGVSFRWPQILGAASSIFFGFLLNIAVNPPSYFTFFDNIILLVAALYGTTVATAMFILPVIFHASHYRKFDVEKFLLRKVSSTSGRYHLHNASNVLGFRTGFQFQATSSNCI